MWPVRHGRDLAWLVAFVGASFSAAGLGTVVTLPALDTWYRTLRKPSWTPPDRLFGPVWTILYAHIGVAGWLVYLRAVRGHDRRRRPARSALLAWGVQLGLNVAWSISFFGRRSPAAGLVVIVLLWGAIASAVVTSARVSRLAGLLLLPYLAWTSFAAALNLRIWQLNRGGA